MAKSLNKTQLIGNVGAEPDIRTTAGGVKVANFSIATNRTWIDRSGQQQEKAEWHRCVAWDKLADIVEQYVHKGDRLFVEGRLEYSQTEDDKGNVRYWTDIVLRDLIMLGSPTGGSGGQRDEPQSRRNAPRKPAPAGKARKSAQGANPFMGDDDDDELPF